MSKIVQKSKHLAKKKIKKELEEELALKEQTSDILEAANNAPLAVDVANLPHSALAEAAAIGAAVASDAAVATTAVAGITAAATTAAGLSVGTMVGIGAGVVAVGGVAVAGGGGGSSSSTSTPTQTPATPATPAPTAQRVKSIQDNSGNTIEAFEYDINGNITKQVSWDIDSNEYETTVFKYNSSGHIVSLESDYSGNDGIFDERADFTRDANGNLLTMKNYKIATGVLEDEVVNTYDSHGNRLSSEVTHYSSGSMPSKGNIIYENIYTGDKLTQINEVLKIDVGGDGTIDYTDNITIKYKYDTAGLVTEEEVFSSHDEHTIDKIFYEDGVISKVEFDSNADGVVDATATYIHEAGAYSTVYPEFFDPYYVFN